MHYHAEVIMPPTENIEAALEKYLAGFSENNEEARPGFWDWYQLGGRYSGSKVESLCDADKMKAFYAELKASEITVSGLQWGKQELSPASQQDAVDAMWLRHFPDSPIRHAPMFKHAGENVAPMDISTVAEIPEALTAYTCLICADDQPITLLHKAIWNGCSHQDTKWGGSVVAALADHAEKSKKYRDEYREKVTVKPDWLCVTVDYHS